MIFEVKNLNFSYDTQKVLKDINFKLDTKEFLVIVGKSGCGKTTLLRTIAGLEKIHQGSIIMNDEEITFKDPNSRNLGYVMQEYPLYPNLSVFENISFGLKNKRLKLDVVEEKVYEVANLLGIYKILNEKPKHLSGGEKQRVCLAKAMISKPKLLLFDEPLSNLDALKKAELRTEIIRLYEEMDIPFIYVTHDQEEALSLATKIMYMDEGKIVQFDDKENLLINPKNLMVAEFFSNPKLNLFNAQINKEQLEVIIDDKESYSLHPMYFDLLKDTNKLIVGIKPEYIMIDETSNFAGVITSFEMHGSKYLYKVTYNNEYIFIKSSHHYPINSNIHFTLPFEHLFFFNSFNKTTISLYHYINRYPITIKENHLYIQNQNLDLDNHFLSSLLIKDLHDLFLNIPNDAISVEPREDYLKLQVQILESSTFESKHFYKASIFNTDYCLYFSDLKSINQHILQNVYINKSKLFVTNKEYFILNTKLPITQNRTTITLKSSKDYSKIKLGHKTFKFEKINYPNGDYIIEILPTIEIIEKCENPKVLKKVYQKYIYSNVLLASSYDEDFIGDLHIIYIKVDGFTDYLTLISSDKFSVYKEPELILSLKLDSIKFISKASQ